MDGLIHIYEGNGKGKTTAGVGLAVRCAGRGRTVVYAQFLKDGSSGEIGVLKSIPGILVITGERNFGFTFRMNEEQKKEAAAFYRELFHRITKTAVGNKAGLLVMDEVLDACNSGMLDTETLVGFLKSRPKDMEVVLTGRNPAPQLVEMADYITQMRKVKHPFDQGIAAREGI